MTILLVDLWLLWCVFFFGLVSLTTQSQSLLPCLATIF
jgi:hypothetical protein